MKEYTGTGASGGNATDGNDITSPRPFADDMDEIENYTFKSVYGGDGGHYVHDPAARGTLTRDPRGGMFENKDEEILEEEELEEQDMSTIQKNKQRALIKHALKGVDIEKLFTRREFNAQRSDLEKPRAELNKAEQEALRALNQKKIDIQNQMSGQQQQSEQPEQQQQSE